VSIGIGLFLVLLTALISYLQEFKIEKALILAALRTILQLFALGFVLGWIFTHSSLWVVLAAALFMTLSASYHSALRVKNKHPGLLLDNFLAIALAIWPLSFLGTQLLSAGTWWQPELYLPLVGMMLGNSLNGLSLGIDHFTNELKNKREEVLSMVALGATTPEATHPILKRSIHLAMTPTLNSMASMGIVSIPGMMTGQILAGQSPLVAAEIQIIMMLLIAATSFFGIWIGLTLSRRKLFNKVGQLCY
jgi:putative ABC transport system permease protein